LDEIAYRANALAGGGERLDLLARELRAVMASRRCRRSAENLARDFLDRGGKLLSSRRNRLNSGQLECWHLSARFYLEN
jgi:hypothetical protein